MKSTAIIAALITSTLTGCSSRDTQADALLETTHGEEIRINREHAAKPCKEVAATYYSTPAAKVAAAHLTGFKLNTLS
ncbi:MAG: hypothetical protein M0T70_17600 [Geobacteraceae bacterium]|nr:hypothetical protein [Geobacteraceae bacterium]